DHGRLLRLTDSVRFARLQPQQEGRADRQRSIDVRVSLVGLQQTPGELLELVDGQRRVILVQQARGHLLESTATDSARGGVKRRSRRVWAETAVRSAVVIHHARVDRAYVLIADAEPFRYAGAEVMHDD